MAVFRTKNMAGAASRKKSKPVHSWRIGLIGKTPQKYLGRVDAATEAAAIEEAAKEFRIKEALRNKLVAHREG